MSFSSDQSQLYNQLPISIEFPAADHPDFVGSVTDAFKDVANSVNSKEGGLYDLQELSNSEQWFIIGDTQNFRFGYRMTVNFGALPNTGTKSVAHGIANIDANFSITRLYASASDPVGFNYIPIPFASPVLANNISLSMDNTNVTIITGSNRSAFTICYVIIDYLRN